VLDDPHVFEARLLPLRGRPFGKHAIARRARDVRLLRQVEMIRFDPFRRRVVEEALLELALCGDRGGRETAD
jgi:hypothetical protein